MNEWSRENGERPSKMNMRENEWNVNNNNEYNEAKRKV